MELISLTVYRARKHYKNALEHFNKEEYQKAFEEVKEAINFDSSCGDYYKLLGDLLFYFGKDNQQFLAYKKAYELGFYNVISFVKLGNMYVEMGDYKNAEKIFKKAIDLGQDYAYSYYYLAELYKKLGEVSKAIRNYEKFIKYINKKGSIGPYSHHYDEWYDEWEEVGGVYLELGWLYIENGKYKKAIKCFKIAENLILSDKSFDYLYLGLMDAYKKLGYYRKEQEAQRLFFGEE